MTTAPNLPDTTALKLEASQFHARHANRFQGGYTVFSPEGTLCGWIACLSHPQGWRPGCLALSAETDELHMTIGGNDSDGATSWEPVPPM